MQFGETVRAMMQKQIEPPAQPATHTEQSKPKTFIRGPFQLDVTRGILNANKGPGFLVPHQFMPVLKLLLQRDPDAKCRPGVLGYDGVAAAYRRGGIEADITSVNEKVVKQRLREQLADIEKSAVKIAQEFARSFYRWLRE